MVRNDLESLSLQVEYPARYSVRCPIVAGLIVYRFVGASWLAQQIAVSTRSYVTSALVGIAGSFVGFHLAGLVKLSTGFVPLVAAAVAALMIVWWWRTLKL